MVAGVAVDFIVRRWPAAASPSLPRPPATGRAARTRAFARARLDPGEITGLALTVALAMVVVGAAVVGIVLDMVHENDGLAQWDRGAAEWGSRQATVVSTNALRAITQLGGTVVIVAVAVIAVVIEYRRRPQRAIACFLLVVILGEALIVAAAKWVVDRARPDIDPLIGTAGTSFPSGHSAAAAAFYAAAALVVGRSYPLRWKAALAGAAVGIAVAVASSRVFLGSPLGDRRRRRSRPGVGLVRLVLDRLRRSPAPVRSPGRALARADRRWATWWKAMAAAWPTFSESEPAAQRDADLFGPTRRARRCSDPAPRPRGPERSCRSVGGRGRRAHPMPSV